MEITQRWADRDKASRFMEGWCHEAEARQRRTNDAYWRLCAELERLDKPGGPIERFRRGELTPPPPDVCIEGLEVLKWGSRAYEDRYGARDREETIELAQRAAAAEESYQNYLRRHAQESSSSSSSDESSDSQEDTSSSSSDESSDSDED